MFRASLCTMRHLLKKIPIGKKTFCCRFRLDDSHRFEVAGRGHVCDGGSERPVVLKLAPPCHRGQPVFYNAEDYSKHLIGLVRFVCFGLNEYEFVSCEQSNSKSVHFLAGLLCACRRTFSKTFAGYFRCSYVRRISIQTCLGNSGREFNGATRRPHTERPKAKAKTKPS